MQVYLNLSTDTVHDFPLANTAGVSDAIIRGKSLLNIRWAAPHLPIIHGIKSPKYARCHAWPPKRAVKYREGRNWTTKQAEAVVYPQSRTSPRPSPLRFLHTQGTIMTLSPKVRLGHKVEFVPNERG